jgi:hypothetical protein
MGGRAEAAAQLNGAKLRKCRVNWTWKELVMRGVSVGGKGNSKILDRLRGLPPGTLVPVEAILEHLADEVSAQGEPAAPDAGIAALQTAPHWRVLLWTVPAETRIGREELLEAVGRPKSWLYRHTAPKAAQRIPHRKLDGELVFVVGELRAWLKAQEEIVQAGPLDSPRLQVAR